MVPRTNGELALYLDQVEDSLDHCNVDKAALRAWRDSLVGSPTPAD